MTSRSLAGRWIAEGRVSVNGRVVRLASARCLPGHDVIRVDGKALGRKTLTYVILHKPAGVVTTRADERGRRTVYDLLGDPGRWLFPVGRLDKETSGLLIMTNDNRLGEELTSPASRVWKRYEADLDIPVTGEVLRRLQGTVSLDGERLLPARVRKLAPSRVVIEIHEGKNRQVRRMCEAAGARVTALVRTRIGGLGLSGLRPGEWKELSQEEIRKNLWPRS